MRRQELPIEPRRGWLLVGLIVLVSIVLIAFVGITFFLTEHLRTTSLRQNQTKAIYLAQAGIMQAIYDIQRMTGSAGGVSFRDPATSAEYVVDAGSSPGTSDDNVFTLGGVGVSADFFLVNMKGSLSFPQANNCSLTQRDRFQGWSVTNVLASNTAPLGIPVTVNQVKVDWNSPAAGGTEKVLRIDLNGNTVYNNCTGTSIGSFASLTTTPTINSRQTWPAGTGNRIWFNTRDVASVKTSIDLTFRMTDNSETTSHYESTVANRSADVRIKALGEVRKGAFPFVFPSVMWRRLQATYRLSGTAISSVGNLVAYGEMDQKTP